LYLLLAVELTKVNCAKVSGIDKEVCSEEIAEPSAGSERQWSVEMKRCRPISISTKSATYTSSTITT